ncbi:MAG: hypothetical protein EXX96DRAFT_635759 [Benjaminiella poitrasii]|nr:MAG: hypothetical protein EXX96DRAFT_635759 [Benjaminiella poitrasii]
MQCSHNRLVEHGASNPVIYGVLVVFFFVHIAIHIISSTNQEVNQDVFEERQLPKAVIFCLSMPQYRTAEEVNERNVVYSAVTRHRDRRCTKANCLQPNDGIRRRLWNRDFAAVLNFKKIMMSLRQTVSEKNKAAAAIQKDRKQQYKFDKAIVLRAGYRLHISCTLGVPIIPE